jgi:hypothetical protein
MIDVLEKLSLQSVIDNFKEKKFAHYAEKTSVTKGYILGTPVLALCGKLFIPSRDPEKFTICPICKDISEALLLPNVE